MQQLQLNQKVHYTLRTAMVMCFIGHGIFGIITKPIWCNYFAVFGIGSDLSYRLMPVVGGCDVLLGLITLIYPIRAIAAWLIAWGFITASLRPLSGEPFAELIERAGNFGAPLAFLILAGIPENFKGWFTRVHSGIQIDAKKFNRLTVCLRILVFLLLLGHGWLNMIEKKSLLAQYSSIGFTDPSTIAQIVGVTEIFFSFVILVKPVRSILLTLFIWKMISEVFYPHYGLFEWIERGGSYGALLALWLITETKSLVKPSGTRLVLK